MRRRSILLIPTHQEGWLGLGQRLDMLPEVRVIGETTDWREARRLATAPWPEANRPAATVDNHSFAARRADGAPRTKILVLGEGLGRAQGVALIDLALAQRFLLADLAEQALEASLSGSIDPKVVAASHVAASVFIELRRHPINPEAPPLTARERLVLRCLATGQRYAQIAEVTMVSRWTVGRTVAQLKRKLDAPNLFVLGFRVAQFNLL